MAIGSPFIWTIGWMVIIILLLWAWLLPVMIAISNIRKHEMNETAMALWVMIILLFPIVGATTYFVVNRRPKNLTNK